MGYETTPPGLKKSFDTTSSFVRVEEEAATVAPGVRENSQPTNTKERKEVEDHIAYIKLTGRLLDAIRKAAIGDDKRDDKEPPLTPGQKKPLRSDEFDLAA